MTDMIITAQSIGARRPQDHAVAFINPYLMFTKAVNDDKDPDGGKLPAFMDDVYVPPPPTPQKPKAKLKVMK